MPTHTDNQIGPLEELQIVVETGRQFFNFYLKGVAFYIAILGFLLKFFFDAASDSSARASFFFLGVMVNVAGISATKVGLRHYRALSTRCSDICQRTNIPNIYYPGPIAMARLFLLGMFIVLLLWLALLRWI